ncbi:MAG: hypothetical protein WCI45_13170, partial [Desulfuromonadales bacterium]
CSAGQHFGSDQRRKDQMFSSRSSYLSKWGLPLNYCIYFGVEVDAVSLGDTISSILDGARKGHYFVLMLHRGQYSAFRKMGWNGLHTGIVLQQLSLLFPLRDLQRKIAVLRSAVPDMLTVQGSEGMTIPGAEAAISIEGMLNSIQSNSASETLP